MSCEDKDLVKADIFIYIYMFIFLKIKQISIFKRKTYQTMKDDEQMAMKISPMRREDLVNGTSGPTNKKLMVGKTESCNYIIVCQLSLGRHQSNTMCNEEARKQNMRRKLAASS